MRALTTTTKRTKRIIILGLAAFGLMAGVAVATPGLGVSAATHRPRHDRRPFKVETDGLVELKTKGPIDVADQTITIQPGGHTGWHSHPDPRLPPSSRGRSRSTTETIRMYAARVQRGIDVRRRGRRPRPHRQKRGHVTPVEVSVTYLTAGRRRTAHRRHAGTRQLHLLTLRRSPAPPAAGRLSNEAGAGSNPLPPPVRGSVTS